MAFANLFLDPLRKKYIGYLQPYKTEYNCFFIKKPPLNPKWQDLMIPFQQETWFAILATGILCTLVVSVINGIALQKGCLLSNALINIVAIFLDQSIPFRGRFK